MPLKCDHLLDIQVLSWWETFVEVGVERVQHGLHPGPVDQPPPDENGVPVLPVEAAVALSAPFPPKTPMPRAQRTAPGR